MPPPLEAQPQSTFKAVVRRVLARLSIELAGRFPNRLTIQVMHRRNTFLTTPSQIDWIAQTIRKRKPCNLLIFGLGNDSLFYQKVNKGGRTVFLEDHEDWFRKITAQHPGLEAYKIHFKTKVKDWRKYQEQPHLFETTLPGEITSVRWDIIFVDAPNGFFDDGPGRMESIRLASLLIQRPGDVFVHDCEREVENIFSTHYLKAENLRKEVANLRHYVFSVTSG